MNQNISRSGTPPINVKPLPLRGKVRRGENATQQHTIRAVKRILKPDDLIKNFSA
jgi:hypothetical protein